MKPKFRLILSLKIWTVLYPSITLFLSVFGAQLSVLPLYLRTMLITLCLVPWVVFVGLPFLESVLRFASARRAAKKEAAGRTI